MRAAIAAESAGIPSVSLVCEGFEGQALATGRGHGYDGLPLGVLVGHVDAQSADVMAANFTAQTLDQVIDALTAAPHAAPADASADPVSLGPASADPASMEVVASGSFAEIQRVFGDRGWTDGSPVAPPTLDAVEAFLAPLGHDPHKVLGIAKSSGRDLTIWSIAVNAVMAGCDPAHLPVLIAATEILADPHYGAEHSGNTTGADALMILSGPTVQSKGFNAGQGALREGVAANTTVGRWLRLYLRNVFDFTADQHDKATFGNSTRVALTEDHDALTDLGWPTIGADLGTDGDAVSMARFNSGLIIGSVFGSSPDELLPYLGDGLARSAGWDLTHVFGLGHNQFRPLLILSPILARIFGSAGWSKPDVQTALFDHARIPAHRFESLIGAWSNLTAGRRQLVDLVADGILPEVFAVSNDPERLVPIVTDPSQLMITVAGDPNRTNAYVLSNDGPHGDWTARAIDWSVSSDLVCEIPD